MPPPRSGSVDGFSLTGPRRVAETLLAEVERLRVEVGDPKLVVLAGDAKILEQAEEIARLKGLPPRPKFPSKGDDLGHYTTPL